MSRLNSTGHKLLPSQVILPSSRPRPKTHSSLHTFPSQNTVATAMAKKGEKQPQAPKRKRNSRTKEEADDSFVSSSTMEIDHYKILEVDRNASPNELRTSYKSLVMVWHPDKHLQEKTRAEAETKFKKINEAYQILNDPEKRQKYDRHHANIANSKRTESSFWLPPREDNNAFATMFGSGGWKRPDSTVSTVYSPLICSLEELYQGTTKKMKLTRAVTNGSGEETTVGEILQVNIKPGYRAGTKMTYNGGDLGFVIQEKQHSVYERDRNDLIVHQEITLLEALIGGKTLDLTTLDGRKLVVPLPDDVIRAPGDEMIVPGEGMPISSQPGAKGNLRIKFNVKFPSSSFTAEQKLDLKKGFEGVSF